MRELLLASPAPGEAAGASRRVSAAGFLAAPVACTGSLVAGEILTRETPAVQRARDQYVARTRRGERREIRPVAHAAGGDDLRGRGTRLQPGDERQIGTLVRAHAVQVHRNDGVRPQRFPPPERGWTEEAAVPAIQRQDGARRVGEGGAQRKVVREFANALRSDDAGHLGRREIGLERGRRVEAGIDPPCAVGMRGQQALDDRARGTTLLYRVEVGNVECGNAELFAQGRDDIGRRRTAREQRAYRPVVGAVAAHRVYDHAVLEIDDRDAAHALVPDVKNAF